MKRGPPAGSAPRVSLANARDSWPEGLPDWLEALARAADRTSQAVAARAIGYSGSVVSSVLKGSYNGDLAAVEKAVRGRFLAATVACPVAGEIGADICLAHQKRAQHFSAGSSFRVEMARACKGGCPHSRIGRTA